MKFSTFLPAILATTATAQTASSAYTDAKTGISYQAFSNANILFGVALDTNGTQTDFIGTIVAKGKGWAGVSLGGPMVGKLLIAAWPNSNAVVSTFRKATAKSNPPAATGSFTMTPIASGTFVNTTHFSYTFLCKGCILADGTTFKASGAAETIGWAHSTTAPTTPASASSALNHHSSEGTVKVNVAGAQSAKFGTWAALASPAKAIGFKA
ncbi:hypothetical protein BGZ60DRAFT_532836 [Tricladium varicosporioides]|nr:hypothetical protein BGZ60DRAFT_532836 [Hymenoscyphus varicosporioides]